MATKPITPKEAFEKKFIPDEVITIFNDLIQLNLSQEGTAKFKQEDVIERIIDSGFVSKEDKQTIFDKKWLDVEVIYQRNGWDVEYDKPGFNEDYSAYFIFKCPKNS